VNEHDIANIGKHQKAKIEKQIKLKRFDAAISSISNYAQILYWAPICYSDNAIESAISQIANCQNTEPKKTDKDASQDHERALLIDSFGFYSGGLVPQYLDALSAIYTRVQYIYTGLTHCHPDLVSFIGERKNIDFVWIPCASKQSDINDLTSFITSNAFTFALFHIAPWRTAEVVAAAKINIRTFLIDITDHSFWLGAQIFDHFIGFRKYGQVVAAEKRGIPKDRYSIVQFYPVPEKQNYQGLPAHIADNIKILTGGAEYKLFGRNARLLHILGQMVIEIPNLVVCVLGDLAESQVRKAMGVAQDQCRVVFLGYRDDVASVIASADVFVPTFPWGGGLLTEYAIASRIPVVALEDSKLPFGSMRGLLLRPDLYNIGFTDEAEFILRLRDLCLSDFKRKEEARLLAAQLPTPETFAQNLGDILVQRPARYVDDNVSPTIDYGAVVALYLDLERGKFGGRLTITIMRSVGFAAIIRYPTYALKALRLAARLLVKKHLRDKL